MPINKTRLAGNKNPESAQARKARTVTAAVDYDVDADEAPKAPGLKAITKDKAVKHRRRAIAEAMLSDEATEAEILMAQNPKHAGRIGLDSRLYAQGAHEPAGSTVQKGQLANVFDNHTTAIHRDDRKIRTVSASTVMYVELFGHRKLGRGILEQAANNRGKKSIVTEVLQGRFKGVRLGLSHALTANEKRDLADLGARFLTTDFKDMDVKRDEGRKPGKDKAGIATDVDMTDFVQAAAKPVAMVKVTPKVNVATWTNDPESEALDVAVTEAEIAIHENHELASRQGLVTQLVMSGHHLPTELAEIRAVQAEQIVEVEEPAAVSGPALIL